MKFIKTIVTLVVLLAVVGVGIVIAAPKYPQAQMVMEKLHLAALQPVADETLASAAQIQTRLPQLGSVLGIKTEARPAPNSNEASLPQKTLEYARYAYCQQVVKDYESRNGINSASASAKPRPSETPHPTSSPHVERPSTNKK